jgi:hypothetical protein
MEAKVIAIRPDVARDMEIRKLRQKELDLFERLEKLTDAVASTEAEIFRVKMERTELELMAAAEDRAMRNWR